MKLKSATVVIMVKKFKRGDKLNLAELRGLRKYLRINLNGAEEGARKQKLEELISEVQDEIEYWEEMEKIQPGISFEKYSEW